MITKIKLSERENYILNILLQEYINTARPVGSRKLKKEFEIGLSPATIRNVLADLEDKGFLEQPHISAGRIPTEKAYRYYVNSLKKWKNIDKREIERIKQEYRNASSEIDTILKTTSRILSIVSNEMGVVLGLKIGTDKVKEIKLIKIYPRKVITVCLLNSGILLDKIVELNEDLPKSTLERIGNFINHVGAGKSIFELKEKVENILKQKYSDIFKLKKHIKLMLEHICSIEENIEQIYTGNMNFIDDPELEDINRTRRIIKLLEDERAVKQILVDTLRDNDLKIRIGKDLKLKGFKEFSVITAPYKLGKNKIGVLGIIGPMRMEYVHLISIVTYISKYLSTTMGKLMN